MIQSATTFGSGNWAFSLPIESKDTGGVPAIGSCLGLDSGTAFFTGACIINSSGTWVEVFLGNNVGNFTNDLTPFSWAQNDYLKLEITYPIE